MRKSFILLLFLSCWIYLIGCKRKNTDHKSDQHKKNALLKSKDEKRENSTTSKVKNLSDKRNTKIVEKDKKNNSATASDLHKLDSGKKANEVNKIQNTNSTLHAFKRFELPGFLKLIDSDSKVGVSTYQIVPIIGNLGDGNPSDANNDIYKFKAHNCTLRSRVIDVEYSPGYITLPASISVNECSGNTMTQFQKCVPEENENVTREYFYFSEEDFSSGKPQKIKIITTQEPKSCQLVCRTTALDCKPDYVYSSDSCTCTCPKIKPCSVGKQWSSMSCACECSNVESRCRSNTFWNTDSCECQPYLGQNSQPLCLKD